MERDKIMRLLLAVPLLALATACASTDIETEPVAADAPPIALEPSAFDLAMGTVDQLVAAGNEQAAILRLEQLIGMQTASDDEKAEALFRMAELKLGDGNQVWGGIMALDELIDTYPAHGSVPEATQMREEARGEATSLNGVLETGGLSPMEEFEYRFRLGEHQEASDIMFENALNPDNAYILDMYQIGYLCDAAELTGPSYDLVEPDGTNRSVRFCDFGK